MGPHLCDLERKISAQTKISQLLEVNRDLVIKTLTGLNSKFSRLKNPVLRNLLIKRVSIADACKISNTDIVDFMQSMEQIGFHVANGVPVEADLPWVANGFDEAQKYLELDVPPLLAHDNVMAIIF